MIRAWKRYVVADGVYDLVDVWDNALQMKSKVCSMFLSRMILYKSHEGSTFSKKKSEGNQEENIDRRDEKKFNKMQVSHASEYIKRIFLDKREQKEKTKGRQLPRFTPSQDLRHDKKKPMVENI